MGGKKAPANAAGNATMQLDAVVDDMEEVEVPDLGHSLSAPPPLPPKKAGASAWLTGVAVVLVAAGAAVGIGLTLKALRPPAAAPAAAAPAAAEADDAEEPDEAAGAEEAQEAEAPHVQLDDIVFGDEAEPEAGSDAPAAPEAASEPETAIDSDGEAAPESGAETEGESGSEASE